MEDNLNSYSNEIIKQYMVRKNRRQKTAFINRTKKVLEERGYPVTIEQGGLAGSRNIVVGDITQAKVIYTAHYDTCPVMPVPNFVTPKNILFYIIYQLLLTVVILGAGTFVGYLVSLVTNEAVGALVSIVLVLLCCYQIMAGIPNPNTYNDNTSGVVTLIEIIMKLPIEHRGRVAFVFFDHEEIGLVGSSQFYKKHRKILRDTAIINFDCVSDGDYILAISNRRMKKDAPLYDLMKACLTSTQNKRVEYTSSSTTFYPSDQMKFNKYFGIAAVRKAPVLGYYMGRIHTPFDTVFDVKNIELLSNAMVQLSGRI